MNFELPSEMTPSDDSETIRVFQDELDEGSFRRYLRLKSLEIAAVAFTFDPENPTSSTRAFIELARNIEVELGRE